MGLVARNIGRRVGWLGDDPEMVRSTMPQMKSKFTGLSPVEGNRDNYVDAYRAWREVDHICAEWSYMPLSKDPEVFPSEGYLIKTRSGNNVSTTVPESYFYAKFSIASLGVIG